MPVSTSHKNLIGAIVAATLFGQASAEIYINETFDLDTVASNPADPTQRGVTGNVLVQAGIGVMGADNVARFTDASITTGEYLEYNVGPAALGSLYASFDLFNNAPSGTGSGTNPITFGFGSWNDDNGIKLSSNASRAFNVEVSQNGSTNTLKLRVGGSSVQSTVYDTSSVLSFKIFANDHDTSTLSYVRPDTLATAMLGANSFVVYLNNALIGTETASGHAMNTPTVGNATLGRLGFVTPSTGLGDFLIDNIYVSDIVVPEPASLALLGMGAGLAFARRRSA